MRSVLRGVALLILVVFLLAGCSSPTKQITTPAQTITLQPSAAATKSPTMTLISPTVTVGTLSVHFIDVGQGDSILIGSLCGGLLSSPIFLWTATFTRVSGNVVVVSTPLPGSPTCPGHCHSLDSQLQWAYYGAKEGLSYHQPSGFWRE